MNIQAIYQGNYNGFTLFDENDNELEYIDQYKQQAKACQDQVINKAYEECDSDGEYCGDWVQLKQFIIDSVKQHFHNCEKVVVEYDGSTT